MRVEADWQTARENATLGEQRTGARDGGANIRVGSNPILRATLALAFLLLTACGTVWAPVLPPAAPPPPVVAPPVDPPPPVTPPDAPVPVAELVARLAVGSTLAEAEEVMERPADNVAPAFGPAPETRRWFVKEAGQTWAVYVVMRGGKVSSAGSAKVEEVR